MVNESRLFLKGLLQIKCPGDESILLRQSSNVCRPESVAFDGCCQLIYLSHIISSFIIEHYRNIAVHYRCISGALQ